MKKDRKIIGIVISIAVVMMLLVVLAANYRAAWTTRRKEQEVKAFGARVGTLARVIQTEALNVQAELGRPQPNLHAMQESHARIKSAYIEFSQIGATPQEFENLHDAWIVASFDCEFLTGQAIIQGGGDLAPCLDEISAIVQATGAYLPNSETTATAPH